METFMLPQEGTRIIEELYPEQFNRDGSCKFSFSNGWRGNWMEREGFSYKRTTTKKKKNLSAKDSIPATSKFFLDTRVFQRQFPDISQELFSRYQSALVIYPTSSKSFYMCWLVSCLSDCKLDAGLFEPSR